MRTLTIVIPFFKGDEFLLQCFGSIASAVGGMDLHTQCLIIDNGSAVPELPNFPNLKDISIIRTKYKLGFGRAVNIGIHKAIEAESDYILIANQDTVFAENAIDKMVRQAEIFPQCFLFPIVKERDFSDAPPWYSKKYLSDIDITDTSSATVEVDHQNAVCFIGNKEAFEVAGYFDPSYFMYFEDDDYFARFKKIGGKLLLVKSAEVGHYFKKTSVADAQGESHIWYRNARIRHFARYGSLGEFWGAWLRTTTGSFFKLRFKRLSRGMSHDIDILRNLGYVRNADMEEIGNAARKSISNDLSNVPGHVTNRN